jgi:phosphoribosylformimino-5-aminoimidazole carboxamide ribotide isomerase
LVKRISDSANQRSADLQTCRLADLPPTWDIYPAIDLRQGRVVRLMQGDPDRETQYADEPLHVARRWQAAGTDWLHVVNLDGALDESGRQNWVALERVLTTGLKVQFGGGMRDLDGIRRVLNLGVSRAVIGTAAVENPALVEAALAEFGAEQIALGLDARDGIVRTHGWQEDTGGPRKAYAGSSLPTSPATGWAQG